MSTPRWVDKFDRDDGQIGSAYLLPCGQAMIFDERVIPVTTEGTQSGDSPILAGTTSKKTQVLYVGNALDTADQAVRAVWSHLGSIIGFVNIDELMALATEDPSFTILARMSKDPLLVDLGQREDPSCYDQGYGLRVTCPRDGSMPILKLVKYSARAIAPGIAGPTTGTESDGAFVLATFQLSATNLHVDSTGSYRNMMQSMRLRIRRGDDQVILDAYLNDRNIHDPVMTYTDYSGPLWGKVGVPGFEFLSATSATQPAGTSPYSAKGIPIMTCELFECETIADVEPARTSTPSNLDTYERVTQRVITLVEKNGDSKYTATLNGQTKLQTYLGFVIEAEKDIIRREGYWQWLYKEERVYLVNGQTDYELPENCGELELVRPGNWNAVPLKELTRNEFNMAVGNTTGGGQPLIFSRVSPGPNNRIAVRLWPAPAVKVLTDVWIVAEYFARVLFPATPSTQLPFIPQEHTDVLVYKAAALALLLDSDQENAASFRSIADEKLASLRVANNRKGATRQTVMRSMADVRYPEIFRQVPLLRTAQLGHLVLSSLLAMVFLA